MDLSEELLTVASRITDHVHPMIAKLEGAPETGAQFWRDIASRRAPLTEPDPTSSALSLVTFVWRLDSGAEHVVVQPAGFPNPCDHLLARVPGTVLSRDRMVRHLCGCV